MTLLSISSDAKTVKGEKLGYLTGVLYLAPANTSGIANLCPFASPECMLTCLYTAGRAAAFPKILEARVRRTKLFHTDPHAFVDQLARNIAALTRRAARLNLTPAVRLNGTSDLPWENIKGTNGQTLFEMFPTLQFYDYTKNAFRMHVYLDGHMPANYHLTFSRSELNAAAVESVLARGGDVAVVFAQKKHHPLPETFLGHTVIDGDLSDVRFIDQSGSVIGLRAKGKAKKLAVGGFVLPVANPQALRNELPVLPFNSRSELPVLQ